MAFLHGFLLAFGLILPLGVQNVFVLNQGATQPTYWRALPVVLTASLCDAFLVLLSVTGVSVLVLQFAAVRYLLLVAGTVFLLYMGFVTWRSAGNAAETPVEERKPLAGKQQVLFAVSVSLLNPHALLDTVGVIGTSSLQYAGADRVWFTAACILVSAIWFCALAGVGHFVGRLNPKLLPLLSRISAVVMWGSALYLAVGVL
jgi:L-lysine exporter family protein LysE/ArgO